MGVLQRQNALLSVQSEHSVPVGTFVLICDNVGESDNSSVLQKAGSNVVLTQIMRISKYEVFSRVTRVNEQKIVRQHYDVMLINLHCVMKQLTHYNMNFNG